MPRSLLSTPPLLLAAAGGDTPLARRNAATANYAADHTTAACILHHPSEWQVILYAPSQEACQAFCKLIFAYALAFALFLLTDALY